MDQVKIDNIWNKTDILINDFKKYHLEKKISKVAIEYVKTQIQQLEEKKQQNAREEKAIGEIELAAKDALSAELMASQIKDTAIRAIDTKVEDDIKEQQTTREEKAIIENIELVAKDALATELMASQIKNTAVRELQSKVEEDKKLQSAKISSEENNTIKENIETLAKNTLTSELMASQIKDTAVRELQFQVKKEDETKNLAKQIILELIKKHSALIQTIIAIKKAAIEAVKKSTDIESIEKQLENLAEEFETWNKKMKDVKTKKQIDDDIIKLTEIEEKFKKSLETHNNLAKNITDKDKQIAALKKKNEILNRILNENIKSQMPYLVGLENTVAELKQSILQKDLENIAIQKTLSSLPKIAEPKNDVESSIKNTAINALKDSVMNNVIEYNKILFEDNKNLIETMITKDLENIAKTTLVNELLKKSVPGSSTGSNIENDLKHAALTALYSALLGVSKEHVDPSKPPSEYDILITDKTYKYDEKTGERKEIPEFTKYDSIFDDSILAK